MNRSMMMGLITGGLIGATVGMYAINNMSPRERKRAMKTTRRLLTKATGIISIL